jgi:hypothetical protein
MRKKFDGLLTLYSSPSSASLSFHTTKRSNGLANNALEQNSGQMIEDRRAVHRDRAV